MRIPFIGGVCRLTSPYGRRTLNGVTATHKGYDLVGVSSSSVTAAEGGRVVQSRMVTDKTDKTWEWGNYVCILTASGQYHYYCHLASRAVTRGETVRAGQVLGEMGNTGYSFGAHLHFEVRDTDGRTALAPSEVLGIPNAVGTYRADTLEEDIAVLLRRGVLSTPAYWREKARTVLFLPELLHNVAEALEGDL